MKSHDEDSRCLIVLLITYWVVKSHFILLFDQIKKEKKRKEKKERCVVDDVE